MTDRVINKVLAEVAGVTIRRSDYSSRTWLIASGGAGRWDALHDHNQMALVKAGLSKQGWSYSQQYWQNTKFYEAWLNREVRGYPSSHHFCIGQSTVSELRALAEAVRDMRENNYDQANR